MTVWEVFKCKNKAILAFLQLKLLQFFCQFDGYVVLLFSTMGSQNFTEIQKQWYYTHSVDRPKHSDVKFKKKTKTRKKAAWQHQAGFVSEVQKNETCADLERCLWLLWVSFLSYSCPEWSGKVVSLSLYRHPK